MRIEIEKVLARNNWHYNSYLIVMSYGKVNSDIYFVPQARNSGYFVRAVDKKVTRLSAELFDIDCIKEILKYSNRTYKDWIEELIRDNQKQINTLHKEIEVYEDLIRKDLN